MVSMITANITLFMENPEYNRNIFILQSILAIYFLPTKIQVSIPQLRDGCGNSTVGLVKTPNKSIGFMMVTGGCEILYLPPFRIPSLLYALGVSK